jgi:hypothetical protein
MADIKDGILTGYAQTSGNVAATDKVIEAIGKVEKKADDNKTNILLKQNKAIYNELTLASGTYTDYTDVITYTTPANTPCVLIATVFNTGSSPAGVKICAGSSKVMIAKEENTDSSTMYTLTTTGFFTGGNSITVQGKMLGAGTLKASLTAIPISTT